MKRYVRAGFIFVVLCGCFGMSAGAQTTWSVTGPNLSFYVFNNSSNNPSLILQRGSLYTFQVNAIGHPFFIKTVPNSTGSANAYTNGVTNSGVQNGTLTFLVPTNAPSPLYYHCFNHLGMGGMLTIVDPPAPPTPPNVQIVSLTVSMNNVIIKSTGATNWSAIPEFSSNLTYWAAVSSFTNTLAHNTNTTTFSRGPIDSVCGSNVYIRVRNNLN